MKYLTILDIFILPITLIAITLTNLSMKSIGLNNSIIHVTMFFLVYHFMMTLLLKYQIHSDTELVTDYEISNFGSTIISIIAVGVLLFLNLPYVRMILPSYFWIDSLLVTIPVTLAAIMIRLIAGQLRDYSKLE